MEHVNFALLETMRAEGGAVALMDRHCERLQRSAAHFGFACDIEGIRKAIENAARTTEGPECLRLLLERHGVPNIEIKAVPSNTPQRLLISRHLVNSNDLFLRHKTTDRRVYQQARQGVAEGEDVILVNERGEATETTIANIAVLRGGLWITPPISSGLLGGVMRAEFLDRKAITEGVIRVDELIAGETVRCFNALRGLFEARLQF
jgi:para-aminobenzoate synthetase/4-amino-4-deoxychorismate lyase